jgi:hypothetical protein
LEQRKMKGRNKRCRKRVLQKHHSFVVIICPPRGEGILGMAK